MSQSSSIFPVHNSLPMPSPVRQIDGLQLMRAVAVALVAWGHAGLNLPLVEGHLLPACPIYGVDIFFVISGFILFWIVLRERDQAGIEPAWKFLKRRLLRIFPIYWFFCLLNFIRMALAHRPFESVYIPALFLLPSSIRSNPTSSSAPAGRSSSRCSSITSLPFCCSAPSGAPSRSRSPYWRRSFWWASPSISNGRYGSSSSTRSFWSLPWVRPSPLPIKSSGTDACLGIVATLLGVVLSLVLYLQDLPVAFSMQTIMANQAVLARVATWGVMAMLLVGGIVFWSPSLASVPGKVAIALGNASYSIYLASPLTIEYSMRFALKLAGQPSTLFRLFSLQLFIFISVMLLGWLCYNLVEWPMLQLLQKKLLRR